MIRHTVNGIRDNNIHLLRECYISKAEDIYDLGFGNLNEEIVTEIPMILPEIKALGQYHDSAGEMCLRNEIAKYVSKKANKYIFPNQLMVTNGATFAINILAIYLNRFRNLKKLLLQEPAYDTAINIFNNYGYVLSSWKYPFNLEDLNVFDVAYLSFSFHNPSGMCFDVETEKKAKNYLLSNGAYLIEDDPYYFLHTDNRTLYLPDSDNYFYIGSFSKNLNPSLRIGYIYSSEESIKELIILQKYLISHPNIVSQVSLYNFLINNDIYSIEYNKAKILQERRSHFEKYIATEVKSIFSTFEFNGFYYWGSIDIDFKEKLISNFIENGLFILPGDIYFYKPIKRFFFRISISNLDKIKIKEVSTLLNFLLENILRSH